MEEENWRFPYEVNLLFFGLLLLHGSFALITMLLFALRFRMIFAHYVLVAGNFEIAANLFLYCFVFNLLSNYSLFHSFICKNLKFILDYLSFMCFEI